MSAQTRLEALKLAVEYTTKLGGLVVPVAQKFAAFIDGELPVASVIEQVDDEEWSPEESPVETPATKRRRRKA